MPQIPLIHVRPGTRDDIAAVANIGIAFFEESNFRELHYDIVRFESLMQEAMEGGQVFLDVAVEGGTIVGFIVWSLERLYTVEWVASLFLFYVHPNFRGSTAGRELLQASQVRAKAAGAAVFYAASTAGISSLVDTKIENLLVKLGFELLGRFGRKVL